MLALRPTHSLCLKGWEKGVVFINGQNLGRYWNVGPQETLYLPGAWLDQGINQVGALAAPSLLPRPPAHSRPPWYHSAPPGRDDGREDGREALATVCQGWLAPDWAGVLTRSLSAPPRRW